MHRVRRTLVAAGLALTVLIFGAPAAEAAVYGGVCYNVTVPTGQVVQVCVYVNRHDFNYPLREGLISMFPNTADVWIDYLKLTRAGNTIVQTNPDRWYEGTGSPVHFEHSTDWTPNCNNNNGWQAVFRAKFRFYQNNGTGGPFVTLVSNQVTVPGC
jgi:hypothetical protein